MALYSFIFKPHYWLEWKKTNFLPLSNVMKPPSTVMKLLVNRFYARFWC